VEHNQGKAGETVAPDAPSGPGDAALATLGGVTSTGSSAAQPTDMAAVVHFEQPLATHRVTEALLSRWAGTDNEPRDVRDAAARLLRAMCPAAVDTAGALDHVVDQLGDDRERTTFTAWSLAIERPSLSELAAGYKVSATRMGQVRDRVESRVRAVAAQGPPPIPWLVRSLRARLGRLTTTEDAAAALADHGVDRDSQAARVALWLVGPFLPVAHRPGWMATDPRAVTNRTTSALAADGGVREIADLEAELADLGVLIHQVRPWLAACSALAVGETVVSLQGTLGDSCERVLDASGRALGVEELHALLVGAGRTDSLGAVAGALRGRRFRPTGGQVALAAWPVPSAKKPPTKKLLSGRGPASTVGGGDPDDRGGLRLWVRVDADVLAGEEAAVPQALVDGLGVARLRRRSFSSRYGPVTLSHDGPSPTRGSVRAIALAAGATVGDTLLMGFSAAGSVDVELRHSSEPTLGSGALQLELTAPSGPDRQEGAQ